MARKARLFTREKRLGALGAYLGEVGPLIAELESGAAPQKIRTFSQTAPDDITQALRILATLDGAGVVVHGARGCSSALTCAGPNVHWATTNLDQRDTILGSDDILARTVRRLHDRYRPWAIFIVGTPVVAINNDDIRSAAAELSEELAIPVIEVLADGFRSRIAATGFDAIAQALLKSARPAEGGRHANLVNLLAIETGAGLDHIRTLLGDLGLEVNLLPHGADAHVLRRAASAALNVAIHPDETEFLGRGLADAHGAPFLRLPPPIGVSATRRFIGAITETLGLPSRPEAFVKEETTGALRGRRVALALAPSIAFAAADLVEDLGGIVVGVSVDHIDVGHVDALKDFAGRRPDLPLHVADGQPFEHANRLARLAPALFLGPANLAALAASSGIPAVAARPDDLLGAYGMARLERLASRALSNTALTERLAASRASPYRPEWFRRSPDWHIKFEVK